MAIYKVKCCLKSYMILTLLKMGLFFFEGGGCLRTGTVIPYPKKIQKIYKSHDTLLEFADISIFSPKISKFCYTKKYRYRLHLSTEFLILLTFFEFLKVFLINMVGVLMMSAKLATVYKSS